ncbi:MAG: ABC transporter ATP-binding protein [Streptosporangiaceae bacterium]
MTKTRTESRAALQVEDLHTAIGGRNSRRLPVNGVSFTVSAGETVAIVGESGSGKTMTALSIMGLLPKGVAQVVGGTVTVGGRVISSLGDRELQSVRGMEIAYMPQDPVSGLNPALTIGFQVTEPLRVHRKGNRQQVAEEAIDLLGKVGIPDPRRAMRAYPHQLSGGMRQRVLLAMCLIGRPSVLIADEPTTAVDVTTQEQILDLLASIQRESRLAMLLITHDLGVVARIATTVLVMYAGRVVDQGRADQVFTKPMHPYTRGLLQSVDFDGATPGTKLFALDGAPPQLGALPVGCAFSPRCQYAEPVCQQIVPELTGIPGAQLSACHVAARGDLPPWAPAMNLRSGT